MIKKTTLHVLKMIAFLGVFSCLTALPRSARAESVINEKFDAPLSPAKWKGWPKGALSSVVEGRLVMKAPESDPGDYSGSAISLIAPDARLNFLKNRITIKFNDLALKGTANTRNQVFFINLFNDNAGSMQTSKSIRFRLEGDGILSVVGGGKDVSVHETLILLHVSLPIRSGTLVFGPEGVHLSLEDEKGPQEKESPWGDLTGWEDALPYFGVEISRSPGSGDVEGDLGGLNVESEPVSAVK